MWSLKDGDALIPITMKPFDLVNLLRDLANISG